MGCNEIIDLPRHIGNQQFCSPSDCAPCTDVQVNWSASERVLTLAPPADSPIAVAIQASQQLAAQFSEAPSTPLDTGPGAAPVSTSLSLRC